MARYLVLPSRGLRATAENSGVSVRDFLISLSGSRATVKKLGMRLAATAASHLEVVSEATGRNAKAARVEQAFDVVSSINEDGVKLIEATPDSITAMRFEQPGLRVVPEAFCKPANHVIRLQKKVKKLAGTTAVQRKLVVTVVRADNAKPLKGIEAIAFTDFDQRTGTNGKTNATGKVTLRVSGSTKYERLYLQHDLPGLWSFMGKNVAADGTLTIKLQPVDLAATDSLRHFHQVGQDTAGAGVKVGVIDSGIALDHPDLVVAGGLGCVPDEPESDFGPLGGAHGSHVAGIIAGRGQSPTGMRGMAPAAEVFSYRVFGKSESSGSNFALVKAIQRGIADGCDVLNMSLGFDLNEETGLPDVDPAVQEAIREAHKRGVLVVAAAGNDGRMPVNYPAMDEVAVAVSAIGRKGTFPVKSSETGDVLAPFGAEPKSFVAAFSNIGMELDVAGAGVGVVSTVPGGYAPMSGTSMACPAVTGVVARLLAENTTILNMPRNSERTDAMKSMLFAQAKTLGFGLSFEGKGLPE